MLVHFRAEARRRWPAWLAVVLLIGSLGGIVLGTVAGARRTSTVYSRLVEATEAWDVLVNPHAGTSSALDIDELHALPQVDQLGVLEGVSVTLLGDDGELFDGPLVLAQRDRSALVEFGRPHVVEGELIDPDDPTSIMVTRSTAEQYGLAAGDQVQLGVITAADFIAWEEAGGQGAPPLQRVPARVTGVVVSPDDIVVDEGFDSGTIYLSAAFADAHQAASFYYGIVVRLRGGDEALPSFRDAVQGLVPDEELEFQSEAATEDAVERGTRPNVIALLALAAVVGLGGVVVAAQAVAAQLAPMRREVPVLAALGVDRRQLRRAAVLRVIILAGLGTVVAVGAAVLMSPLFPVGAVADAEIEPGFHADPWVLVPGALVLMAILTSAGAVAARRLVRPVAADPAQAALSDRIATVAPNPVMTAGLRAALTPNARQPIGSRGATIGLGIAVAAASAALTFGAGLDRLVTTPADYGWSWQALVDLDVDDEGAVADYLAAAGELGGPISHSELARDQVPVGRHRIPSVGIDYHRGDVGPTIVAGERPDGVDEVALGSRTMHLLDVAIGDTVTVGAPGRSQTLTVVGQAVFAGLGTYQGADHTELGKGMLMSLPALSEVGEGLAADFQSVVLSAPDEGALDAALDQLLRGGDADGGLYVEKTPQRPADIRNLEQVRTTPVVVAGVLAVLAGAALALVLVSGVRARRRELALLKTLGFDRRQVACTVAWQATTTAVMALMVGLPLGIALGRNAWGLLADSLGVADRPVIPGAIALLAVGVLVVANLVALAPARLAAMTRAGTALRTEQ